jgi:hypothetical protein
MVSHQPWASFEEWKVCYDSLFNNKYTKNQNKIVKKVEESLDTFIESLDYDKLLTAYKLIQIWKIRNENLNLVLTTSLLLEEIIKVKEKKTCNADKNLWLDSNLLSQKIIRVTNLLIDDLKKKNKNLASNMFLVAKEIGLPEFIVEVRHTCTHKNLPKSNTLIFIIKYLYFWIKENIWDKQYEIFLFEQKLSNLILSIIENIHIEQDKNLSKKINYDISEIENELSQFNKNNSKPIRLEIDNLLKISETFLCKMIYNIIFMNNKGSSIPCLENMEIFRKVYKLLQIIEGKTVSLVLFKYITNQIFIYIQLVLGENTFDTKKTEELTIKLVYISNFLLKYDSVKENYKFDDFQNLISSIFTNLTIWKEFSLNINQIYKSFLLLIGNAEKISCELLFNNQINSETKLHIIEQQDQISVQYDSQLLVPAGSLIFQQLDYLSSAKKTSQFNTISPQIVTNGSISNSIRTKNNEEISDPDYKTFLNNYIKDTQYSLILEP